MIKRILVSFTRDLTLPRFPISKGETWEVRVDRIEREGFKLGGGFVSNSDYKVEGFK